ncbi:MAG TPA: hypothetical protein VF680_12910 [Allosphingosinicella sp.]|jgi:hypothetical protein
MRKFPLLFIAIPLAATAAFAADPKVGARTGAPEQLFAGIGEGNSETVLDQEIAAAAVHPLGSLANPVRVGGPEGAQAYLARLRCGDGSRVKVGARADGGIGAFGTVTDRYPLDCGAAAPGRVDLILDLYHEEHKEDRAPTGLRIEAR